ncbi:hypothetical protein BH23BAC1_BH23BAC1_33260 [soil metagenome]
MPGEQILIFIEINEAYKISYFKEQLDWVKKSLSGVQLIDFDNFSEAFIINKAIEVIKEADKIFVLIDQKNSTIEPGSLIRFMTTLVRQKNKKIKILLNGNNALLEKVSKTLGKDHFYQNISMEDQKELIKEFFTD